MSQTEFLQLIKQMRDTQKEYFKYRTKSALEKSKILERRVDELLTKVELPQQSQSKMF